MNKPAVLIADKELSYRPIYRKVLGQDSHLFICENKSQLAEHLVQTKRDYQIIIIDPDIDSIGLKILDKIKPYIDKTTRVFLTGNEMSDLELRIAFQEYGVEDVIYKPFSETRLLSIFDACTHQGGAKTPVVQASKNRPKIMVVDDSFSIRESIVKLFSSLCDVHSCESGEAAIDLLEGQVQPNLILLDIMMDEMNGFDVLKKIKDYAHLKDTHVICMSFKDIYKFKKKAKDLGSIDYLTKPFKDEYLLQRVRKLLCL